MLNSHAKTYRINLQRLVALTFGLALIVLALLPGSSATSGAGTRPEKTRLGRGRGVESIDRKNDYARGLRAVTPNLLATINVDRTDDVPAAAACTAAANDCSLRGAIAFANLAPGTTINVPAGTYQLTIPGGGGEGFSGNNAIGDVDIRGNNTTIIGAGAATTIIQQTQPNDRVLEVNPNLDPNFITDISGVTITGGRETTNVGGGGIISGAIGNVLTLTDCVISGNAETQIGSSLGGGGISHIGGTLTVTRCTISGNTTRTSGGGISYSAGDPLIRQPSLGTLTIVDSTFSGNTANSGAAGGGALDLFNFNGGSGAYVVRGSSFSGNTAPNARGGAIIVESGPLTLTTSSLSSNSAGISGGAIYSSGSVVAKFSRFVGNSVPNPLNGVTIFSTGVIASAEDSWWGINTGPTANDVRNIAGPVTTLSWLQLQASASPNSICSGGSSTINANIKKRNADADLTVELTGLPAFPANYIATLGSVAGSNFVNGEATATFTAGGSPGTATVDVIADNQVAVVSIQIENNATTDPDNVAVCEGGTASFSTTASGPGPFTFVWKKGSTVLNNGDLGGRVSIVSVGHNSTLTISNVQAGDADTYTVEATGACSTATQSATLSINASTTTSDPADQTVCQGATATFSTTPSGTGPFSYAWTVDGSPFGGNTSSINIDTTSMSIGNHSVSVTVTGTCGEATQSATLTVQEDTSTTDPADQTVCQGAPANFSTTAGGTGPFSYAWTVDGSPTGGDSPNVSVDTSSLSPGNHTVSVTVTGGCGSAIQSATLTVQAPTSTSDPADQTVCQGAPAGFSTTAGGTGPFHYSWSVDGTPFVGDNDSITVDTTSLSVGNHTVSVTTTGTCGSATQTATLTVQANTATTDPADQSVCEGATASFSTTASGTGPFSYAWTVDGAPFGGNSPSINVNTTGFTQGAHTITVTTTGACGSASQTATLNVNNSSPVINVANSPINMWPPNHQYQNFTMSDFGVTATSACDGNLTNNVTIVSVTSDELDDNPGGADGSTTNDIVIAADCKSVQLRRERDGGLDGRVYIITFQVTDSVGNTTTATARVNVPRNNNGGGAVDSGPQNARTCP